MTVPDRRHPTEPSTKSVDEFALRIYRRTYASGPAFATLAAAVRGLKKALGHLRSEAEDPDSLLNQPGSAGQPGRSAAYARKIASLVEDSDLVLTQVETILEKYGNDDGRHGRSDEERDGRIEVVQKEVTSEKMRIDQFLDTVQLHTPSQNQQVLESTDDGQLDRIKDKVDAVAARLFRNRASPVEGPSDDMWQEFKEELEKEGFEKEVLHKNKEVLRAYIRELESHQRSNNGTPPSVRGLLSHGPTPAMGFSSPPYPTAAVPQLDPTVPRALQPFHHSAVPTIDLRTSNLSYEPSLSGESEDFGPNSDNRALISTRDLMAFDEADRMASGLGSMHLMPGLTPPNYSVSPGTSPNTRYLPSGTQPLIIPGSTSVHHMQLSTSPHTHQLGSSPRYVPPYPAGTSPASSIMTPPPPYAGSPPYPQGHGQPLAITAPPTGSDLVRHGTLPRQFSRLAPDGQGQEIPLEAKWTKIRRSLVSPEVLQKAGVRYEARPEFVAILGVLTREQIAEYARLSAEVRNARRSLGVRSNRRPETYRDHEKRRKGSVSDDDPLWDESDASGDDRKSSRGKHTRNSRDKYTPKGGADERDEKKSDAHGHGDTRAIPVIVSPPASVNGDDPSPASTVGPKPILKNKNPHHVRFDGDGPREILPGSYAEKSRRERDRSRDDRDKDRPRDRDRDRERDRDRDRDRRRDRDRDRDRERDRDRDRDRDRGHRSHRDRDEAARDRERGERGDDNNNKKRSTLKESLGAAGIGGAAATLLSVLADAAVHL